MNKSENDDTKIGKAGLIFGITAVILVILIIPLAHWEYLESFLPFLILIWGSAVCGILAIIFSLIALKRSGGSRRATAGLVLGGVIAGLMIIPAVQLFINSLPYLFIK